MKEFLTWVARRKCTLWIHDFRCEVGGYVHILIQYLLSSANDFQCIRLGTEIPIQAWHIKLSVIPNDLYNRFKLYMNYKGHRHISNISHTIVGNKIVDHSDVVGASPVGAAPTTSSFSTSRTPGFNGLGKTRRETFKFWDLVRLILEVWR